VKNASRKDHKDGMEASPMNVIRRLLSVIVACAVLGGAAEALALPNTTLLNYLDRVNNVATRSWVVPVPTHSYIIYVGGTCSTSFNAPLAGAQDCSIDNGMIPGPGTVAFSRYSNDPSYSIATDIPGWTLDSESHEESHRTMEEACDYRYFPPSGYYSTGCWINRTPYIDLTSDIWTAVGELADYLDTHCQMATIPASSTTWTNYTTVNTTCKKYQCFGKFGCSCSAYNTAQVPVSTTTENTPDNGPNVCMIYNVGGSDNVIRTLLALYDDRWNISGVFTSAGAGGGSELASVQMYDDPSLDISVLTDNPSVPTCGFTNYLDVDSARNAYGMGWWAYDDTNGRPIYHMAGTGGGPLAPLMLGANDGAVALHSALGRADVDAFWTADDVGPDGNYYGHYVLNQQAISEGSAVVVPITGVENIVHAQTANRMLWNTGVWTPYDGCEAAYGNQQIPGYDASTGVLIAEGAYNFFYNLFHIAIDVGKNLPF
jgi:hypothetical protein